MDRLCQPTGSLWQLTPSVFVRAAAPAGKPAAPHGEFFRCTACGATSLTERQEELNCTECGARFPKREGIYDFRGGQE
jgi:hypothetical protein